MSNFNDGIIAEFRANAGHVSHGFGPSLVLLHSVGVKTGANRISPVLAIPQADGSRLVAASKGGAPEHPAWYVNLKAHPETVIEIPAGDSVATVPVTAVEVGDDEYDDAWAQFTSRSGSFAAYAERTGGRLIPVIRLVPKP